MRERTLFALPLALAILTSSCSSRIGGDTGTAQLLPQTIEASAGGSGSGSNGGFGCELGSWGRRASAENTNGPTAHVTLKGVITRTNLRAFPYTKIVACALILPGDASPQITGNGALVSVPKTGVATVSLPFAYIPVHANEWAVMELFARSSTGNLIMLGELAGIFNVSRSNTVVTLDATTTRTFQLFGTMLQSYTVSTWDLDHRANLGAELTAAIAANHGVPNRQTGLFDIPELTRLYQAIVPKYTRKLDIKVSPNDGSTITLAPDYTYPSELNLASNRNQLGGTLSISLGSVWGSSIGVGQEQTPNVTKVEIVNYLNADVFQAPAGTYRIGPVYGGHLLIGSTAWNNGFWGRTIHGGYLSPGTHTVEISMKHTGRAVRVDDPIGFAFPPERIFAMQTAVLRNTPLANADGLNLVQNSASGQSLLFNVPVNYSASHNIVTVNRFNPYGLTPQDIELCTPARESCNRLSSKPPLKFARAYFDNGTDLAFYNYRPGGAITSIAAATSNCPNQADCYLVTASAAGKGTLTAVVPKGSTALVSGEFSMALNPAGPSMQNMPITAEMKTLAGVSYYANATVNQPNFTFNLPGVAQIRKVVFSFQIPAAGTFEIVPTSNANW
jgi:hypothetical protein